MSLAVALQGLRIASAALAEGDVEAGGDLPDAEPLGQHLNGEVLIRHPGHLRLERQNVEEVDADGFEHPGLLVQGHQPERLGLGLEEAARMRLEADHPQRRVDVTRRQSGGGDHPLMAAMDAVEVAKGHGGAAFFPRQVAPAAYQFQRH
jgi:hypothetical protein